MNPTQKTCHSELVSESPAKKEMPKQVRNDTLITKAILTKDTLTLPVYHPSCDKWGEWSLIYKRNIIFKKKEIFQRYIEKLILEKYNPKETLLTTMNSADITTFGKKGNYKVSKSNLEDCLLFAGTRFNSHVNLYDDTIYAPLTTPTFAKANATPPQEGNWSESSPPVEVLVTKY